MSDSFFFSLFLAPLPTHTFIPLLLIRYEGGGLFRNIFLTRTSLPLRIADDGVFAPAAVTGPVAPQGPTPADGLTADAQLAPTVAVEVPLGGGGSSPTAFSAAFALYAGAALVAQSQAVAGAASPGQTVVLALPAPLPLPGALLWSIARPFLYTLVTSLFDASGAVVDSVNATLGVRSVAFDALSLIHI